MSVHAGLLTARALIDGLASAGLEAVIVAPGSRSTPLVLAAHAHDDVSVYSHLDERAATFAALGIGRSGGLAAVVTTSGTATANCHPAVLEADTGEVPLIVLTADRPAELQESGANQTVRQTDLFGEATRYTRTLPDASTDSHRVRAIRAIAARAVAEAIGSPPGPVHLNCPFRKPLEPETDEALAATFAADLPAAPTISPARMRPPLDALAHLETLVTTYDRGAVVVGPACLDRETAAAVIAFAETAGYPILADPVSGLRFHPDADGVVCGGYDGFWTTAFVDAVGGLPDLVVRVGPQPVSRRLLDLLDDERPTQVLVDPSPRWRDRDYRLDAIVRGAVGPTLGAVAERCPVRTDRSWSETIARAEAAYWVQLETAIAGRYFEGAIAHALTAAIPAGHLLMAASSMPIRDLERFARPRPIDLTTLANRGLSGIDGTLSTAIGAATALDTHPVALVGDLATYHDLNGLAALDRFDASATIVVVNNDGGGIFHHLPIERFDPPFRDLFVTPHGLDFAAVADQFGLGYTPVHDRTDLAEGLGDLDAGRRHLIECFVDAERSHATRDRVTDAAAAAALEAVMQD